MTIYQQQCLLAYLGYSPGVIDGKSGSNTVSAIKRFQTDYCLTADGICGTMTEKMLIGVVSGTVSKKEAVAQTNTQTNTTVQDTVHVATGTFWDSIRYFRREEFRCKCGGKYCNGYPVEPDEKLIRLAEKVREHFNAPVTVSSGIRCEKHNASVGGVANSKHRLGKAMDFSVRGISSSMVDAYVGSLTGVSYHYCINGNYIHMDV